MSGWVFDVVDAKPTANQTTTFAFGRGGFQEARGCDTGAIWLIDNMIELLDAPNEWFYDSGAGVLYYYANGIFVECGVECKLNWIVEKYVRNRSESAAIYTNATQIAGRDRCRPERPSTTLSIDRSFVRSTHMSHARVESGTQHIDTRHYNDRCAISPRIRL